MVLPEANKILSLNKKVICEGPNLERQVLKAFNNSFLYSAMAQEMELTCNQSLKYIYRAQQSHKNGFFALENETLNR